MKKALIVVGLGYGDEGKGLVTDYLCSTAKKPLVVRANGGHQAGHTVVTSTGKSHIFSNFGAGTFRSIPTYWSSHCTFSPIHFTEELECLKIIPNFYLDWFSPITTHYDILFNRAVELTRGSSRHGSCGVGFGATIDRNENSNIKMNVKDILLDSKWPNKLKLIREYYRQRINFETIYDFDHFNHDFQDDEFYKNVLKIKDLVKLGKVIPVNEKDIFNDDRWSTYIFEGAQGILLDRTHGKSPNITKSNTTSKNPLEMLQRNFAKDEITTEIYYVTRSYLTRHGEGEFIETDPPLVLKNTESESNQTNTFQGLFKKTNLNIDLLNFALRCDNSFSTGLPKKLVITCMDQLVTRGIPVYFGGRVEIIRRERLPSLLEQNFDDIQFSYSSCADDLLPLNEPSLWT